MKSDPGVHSGLNNREKKRQIDCAAVEAALKTQLKPNTAFRFFFTKSG